jgi:hypothetical protein
MTLIPAAIVTVEVTVHAPPGTDPEHIQDEITARLNDIPLNLDWQLHCDLVDAMEGFVRQ